LEDWKRPLGRPSHTWLRAVEADLGQQNIGLASAWRKAAIRDDWRHLWTHQRSSGVCYKRKENLCSMQTDVHATACRCYYTAR